MQTCIRRFVSACLGLLLLASIGSQCFVHAVEKRAEEHIAVYGASKRGRADFEEWYFYQLDADRGIINRYSGLKENEQPVTYLKLAPGKQGFWVRLTSGQRLRLMPEGQSLAVFNAAGKRLRTLHWQYVGPIDGRGMVCEKCLEPAESMRMIRRYYSRTLK